MARSIICTVSALAMLHAMAAPSHAQSCTNASDGVFIQQNDASYREVIPAEGDGGTHTITTNRVSYFPSPPLSPRLAWLWDPGAWWQSTFLANSTEVWVQLSGCDYNDGVVEFYIDGVFQCEWNSKNKGSVLIKLEGLSNTAHTIRIETRITGEPNTGDVSLDYVALPYTAEPKMHFPQLPDETGWDVNATDPAVVADDWRCTELGGVDEICFWGSWRGGLVGEITNFHLSIHEDNPDPDGHWPAYSTPGDVVWQRDFGPGEFSQEEIATDGWEGWFDPGQGAILPVDHQNYFRYCVSDIPNPFLQKTGTVYWLDISATLADPITTHWGWKTSRDVWNDDAVWGELPSPSWDELYEPDTPALINNFNLQLAPAPPGEMGAFLGGFGDDPTFPEWYQYEEWWNVWFYDHPISWDRKKIVHIHIDVDTAEPGGELTLAVNWARYPWTERMETPPYGPPLPSDVALTVCEDNLLIPCATEVECQTEGFEGPCGYYLEDLYIGRDLLFEGPVTAGQGIDVYWVLPFYNPEWISVDVRGSGFGINGFISHRCTRSLNQAFEIRSRHNIPTVTEWGVAMMTLLLLSAATVVFVRRRAATA